MKFVFRPNILKILNTYNIHLSYNWMGQAVISLSFTQKRFYHIEIK